MSTQKAERKKNNSTQNKLKQHKSSKPYLPSKPKVNKEVGTKPTPVNNSKHSSSSSGWAAIAATKIDGVSPQPSKQISSKPTHHQTKNNSNSTIVNSNTKPTQPPKKPQLKKKKEFNTDDVLLFLQRRAESLSIKAKTFKQSGTDWSKPVKAKKDHRTQDVVNFELVKYLRKRGHKG